MTQALEVDWIAIRNQYETGIPTGRLEQVHGIRANTIRVRAHREGWKVRDIPQTEAPPMDIPVEKVTPRAARAGGANRQLAEGFVVLSALPPERRQAVMVDILSRYANGDNLDMLADEHGVSRATIYLWLLGGTVDSTHAELVTAALTSRAMRADRALDEAKTAIDVARAREQARFARLDLERRRPAIYGQQSKLVHEVGPQLAERLLASQQRVKDVVIDGEAVVVPELPGGLTSATAPTIDPTIDGH